MDKELPVSVWPEWKIIEKIGEGSFGKVYKAKRSEQGKTFYSAIKVITIPSSQSELNSVRSESANDQSARDYFHSLVEECIQEVSTMEYFRGNSHIVSVEDYKVVEYLDAIGWDIYIRMEYLTSFLDFCSGKQLTEEDVIQLGIDLCKALEYCQRQNVIHRDIKPENIFVSRFGEFKLGDFGIARELERSMSGLSKKGTFSYMAPEMYKGEAYDSRVDIYSLGIVLYKLRNRNRLPFLNLEKQLITYRDKENALTRRMSGEPLPKPGEAGSELAEIILEACAHSREARYQNPGDFREALEDLKYRKSRKEMHHSVSEEIPEGELIKAEASEPDISKAACLAEAVKSESVRRKISRKGSKVTEEVRREISGAQERKKKPPTVSSAAVRRRKKKKNAKLTPLILAVITMAVAVCVVIAAFISLLLNDQNTGSNRTAQIAEQESAANQELTSDLGIIAEHATEIVDNLNNYNWVGSESEGKISYLDDAGRVMKVLVYPELSAEGYYEEYYYWDEELFFAYIWADQNTLPYLKKDEQKVNLYYYKEGSLIRWIDENNRCHDGETDNEEYVNRGTKYWDQAVVYKNLLNAEETEG